MPSDRHVALWLDHTEARIFHVDAASFDEKTLHAPTHHLHRHPKGPNSEHEHEHPDDAHHFFKAIAHELGTAERVLVVGPSTAKLQFIHYAFKKDPTLEPRIIGIETVDHPTDRQLVAYAKHYFAADDAMQGRPRIPTRGGTST
jgi:hypothetical protein